MQFEAKAPTNTLQALWTHVDPHCASSIPCPRGGHSLTVVSPNRLMLFGGSSRTADFFSDIYAFELETHRWILLEPKGQAPVGRSGHSAIAFKSQLVIFGGQTVVRDSTTGEMELRILHDCFLLDIDSLTWRGCQISNPLPRNGHAAFLVDTTMYIVGGSDENGAHNDVYSMNLDHLLDTGKGEWLRVNASGPFPQPRELHSGVAIATASKEAQVSFFVLAGRSGPHIFNDSFIFDSGSSSWSSFGRCPARAGHSVVNFDSWLLLFGGVDEVGFQNDLLVRDVPAVLSQSRRATQKAKRKHMKGATINKWTSVSLQHSAPSSSSFSSSSSSCSSSSTSSTSASLSSSSRLPDPRFGHSLTAIPTSDTSRPSSFVLFGGMNAETDMNDVWLLTLFSCQPRAQ